MGVACVIKAVLFILQIFVCPPSYFKMEQFIGTRWRSLKCSNQQPSFSEKKIDVDNPLYSESLLSCGPLMRLLICMSHY